MRLKECSMDNSKTGYMKYMKMAKANNNTGQK